MIKVQDYIHDSDRDLNGRVKDGYFQNPYFFLNEVYIIIIELIIRDNLTDRSEYFSINIPTKRIIAMITTINLNIFIQICVIIIW